MKWLAQSTIYRDSVDLVLVDDRGDLRYVARPMEFVLDRREPGTVIGAPTLELPPGSAQSLMQALWDAGLRPNDGRGSDAEVTALKAHIKFAEGVTGALLGRMPETRS